MLVHFSFKPQGLGSVPFCDIAVSVVMSVALVVGDGSCLDRIGLFPFHLIFFPIEQPQENGRRPAER